MNGLHDNSNEYLNNIILSNVQRVLQLLSRAAARPFYIQTDLTDIDISGHGRAAVVIRSRAMAVPHPYVVATTFTVLMVRALVGSKVIWTIMISCAITPHY